MKKAIISRTAIITAYNFFPSNKVFMDGRHGAGKGVAARCRKAQVVDLRLDGRLSSRKASAAYPPWTRRERERRHEKTSPPPFPLLPSPGDDARGRMRTGPPGTSRSGSPTP